MIYTTEKSHGDWCPILEGRTVRGANSYVWNVGEFTWLNERTVLLQYHIKLSVLDALMSGAVQITGIPFPRNYEASHNFPASLATLGYINFPAGYTQLTGTIERGATAILLNMAGSIGGAELPLDASCLTNDTKISGSCLYTVA